MWKVSKYEAFLVCIFWLNIILRLNMVTYGINFSIQSEYQKIRNRKISVFGHFSRSDTFASLQIDVACSFYFHYYSPIEQ